MIPSTVDWRITSACNLNCPFCYGPKGIKSITKENAIEIVDKLSQLGTETVCISGGEPLLYPYVLDVMKAIKNKGMSIYLSTGGNFYQDHRDELEQYVTKLSLPLDGYTV